MYKYEYLYGTAEVIGIYFFEFDEVVEGICCCDVKIL